jgi:hypothetical protein
MLIQCAGCKNYFELEDVNQGQTPFTTKDELCGECLLAHIEKILYGQSRRSEQQSREMVWEHRDVA